MSERMLRPGAPERPKEGIYLDAALAVIGEQVDERIDELSRRRRLRARVGVAALAVFAVASGGAAAVALSAVAPPPPASVSLTAGHELRCADGFDADGAYFTVRYRTVEGVDADAVRLCALARSTADGRFAEIASSTPKQLVAIAEGLVSQALGAANPDADPSVAVDDAAFRPVDGPQPLTPVTCERGRSTLVVWVADASPGAARQALVCARAAS